MAYEIVKTIVVEAPPSQVFKALTDEKDLVQWMPKEAKMDARLGGEYEFKFYWAAKNAESVARGKIVELVPDKKLAYTFFSTNDPSSRASLLTWTLDELHDGSTRVTLVHSGIQGERGERYSGWGYFLGQLSSYCAKIRVSN